MGGESYLNMTMLGEYYPPQGCKGTHESVPWPFGRMHLLLVLKKIFEGSYEMYIRFFFKDILTIAYPNGKTMNLDPYLTQLINLIFLHKKLRGITDLNIRVKTIKLLGQPRRESLQLGISKGFLGYKKQ